MENNKYHIKGKSLPGITITEKAKTIILADYHDMHEKYLVWKF